MTIGKGAFKFLCRFFLRAKSGMSPFLLTWLDFSKTMEAIGAQEKAAEKEMTTEAYFQDWLVMNSGVYINPGSNYGLGGPGNMRFNVGSSRRVIKAALDAMAGALRNA